tara:strand:- start:145 stop:1140 length:996 start_codon:yes stop_codon:yes gene_type:complete
MSQTKVITGINGFGRFGLHLLKYWLDRSAQSNFSINYINDDFLDIHQIHNIIVSDKAVNFGKYKVQKRDGILRFLEADGTAHQVQISNENKDNIPWIGEPILFLECSGKNTVRSESEFFLKGNTERVIISATSWDPDATLVYGYNHKNLDDNHKIISYGSCTVNAYLPLANFINEELGIISSDVNCIHNIQEYQLEKNNTLLRKFCTLEKSATHLLDFISEENFIVNYTVVPYTGVSMIDFRFRVENTLTELEMKNLMQHAINEGPLKGLYGLCEVDTGPEVHNCTPYSSVIVEENMAVKQDSIYLPAYFDNENSVNRYFDLVDYISIEAN